MPAAPQLRTLWNAFVLPRMPPLEMLSIPPLPSSLQTDWISPGVLPLTESSSRDHYGSTSMTDSTPGSPPLVGKSMTKERESGSQLSLRLCLKSQTILFLDSFLSTVSRLRGSFHRFITGSSDLNSSFRRTDADVKAFMKAHLFIGASDDQVNSVADQYSQDPAEVSYLA